MAREGRELSGGLLPHMPGWLMLAAIWDLSWGCQLEHVHMAFPYGMSFLATWQSHVMELLTWCSGSSTIFPVNKVELASRFMTYCWEAHNVLPSVLYWLQANHKLTPIQGERKYTLPLAERVSK